MELITFCGLIGHAYIFFFEMSLIFCPVLSFNGVIGVPYMFWIDVLSQKNTLTFSSDLHVPFHFL